ncbi:MAG: hypothetical protein RMI01_09750 [Thermodesulfovibrio sp.]|nr:hypothetical protein [Thermodesulfovibrio sp.]
MAVSVYEIDGLYYAEFGWEDFGKRSFRLWLHKNIVQKFCTKHQGLKFPIPGTKIYQTENGSLFLKETEGFTTWDVIVQCGFRGTSKITLLYPNEDEAVIVPYYVYESPRGTIGVSMGMLVSAKTDHIIIKYERKGRLYGEPKNGIQIINQEGKTQHYPKITSLEELLNLRECLT